MYGLATPLKARHHFEAKGAEPLKPELQLVTRKQNNYTWDQSAHVCKIQVGKININTIWKWDKLILAFIPAKKGLGTVLGILHGFKGDVVYLANTLHDIYLKQGYTRQVTSSLLLQLATG